VLSQRARARERERKAVYVHTLLYSTAAAGLYAMTSAENAQGEQAIYLAGKILKLLFNHLSLSFFLVLLNDGLSTRQLWCSLEVVNLFLLCYIFLDVYKDRTGINNRIDE
jgi:hypothetical protein